MSNQPRCPYCGKYQQNEPDGYFGKLDSTDDMSGVEVFCNETHYNRYQHIHQPSPSRRTTMRCEDFPCCGHEIGCCPDYDPDTGEQLNMKCTCGASVPLTSRVSLCKNCLDRLNLRWME